MSRKQIGIREDIMRLIDSEEAEEVTQLMVKIYNRLLLAPAEWWESNEALRVRGRALEGVSTSAWTELVNWLRVPPTDAHIAIEWMRSKEIITYQSYHKGREIRISFEGLYYPEDNQR
jgi:hypothetical protein